MKKVIFVSSSGGHLSELLRLEKLFKDYDYLVVTERTTVTEKLNHNMEFLRYGPTKNILKYFWNVIYNIYKCIKTLLKFNPETVISTGAQVGGIMCFFAKVFGKKVIYIESLAKVTSLSVTGKVVYLFADKFYVQWKNICKSYKKAEYIGRLM